MQRGTRRCCSSTPSLLAGSTSERLWFKFPPPIRTDLALAFLPVIPSPSLAEPLQVDCMAFLSPRLAGRVPSLVARSSVSLLSVPTSPRPFSSTPLRNSDPPTGNALTNRKMRMIILGAPVRPLPSSLSPALPTCRLTDSWMSERRAQAKEHCRIGCSTSMTSRASSWGSCSGRRSSTGRSWARRRNRP